jgi:rhodanese-related sulfurtransferase
MKPIAAALATLSLLTANLPALSINEGTKQVMAQAMKTTQTIAPADLQVLIDKDAPMYLLDIREKEQQLHGEIFHLNLVRLSRAYLEFRVENEIPDKKALVVVYCCSGKRSLLTARTLQELGYTNVRTLEGGLHAWVEQGHVLDTMYGEMILKP